LIAVRLKEESIAAADRAARKRPLLERRVGVRGRGSALQERLDFKRALISGGRHGICGCCTFFGRRLTSFIVLFDFAACV
jgi:hypothetical protein